MLASVPFSVVGGLLPLIILVGVMTVGSELLKTIIREKKRRERKKSYNEDYLESEAWERKRHVVLKRDGWKCVSCGAQATEVHHLKYAHNIGREPIEWLISLCGTCHQKRHVDKIPRSDAK